MLSRRVIWNFFLIPNPTLLILPDFITVVQPYRHFWCVKLLFSLFWFKKMLNAEKDDFDQQIACEASIFSWKYTAVSFEDNISILKLMFTSLHSWISSVGVLPFPCPFSLTALSTLLIESTLSILSTSSKLFSTTISGKGGAQRYITKGRNSLELCRTLSAWKYHWRFRYCIKHWKYSKFLTNLLSNPTDWPQKYLLAN